MVFPSAGPTSLLPAAGLPLTAFEETMFLDDRPSHPMLIVARLDFEGGPPPPALAEAFAAALEHEPLLTARVATARRGRPRWLPAPPPALEWGAPDETDGFPCSAAPSIPRLDPRAGPMLAARVVPTDTGWSIVVAVHHAACDGLGLVGFMERWLLRAAGRAAPRRPASGCLAMLRRRGRVAATWREFIRMLPKLAKGLEGVNQFVGRDVVALAGAGAEPGPGAEAASPGADWRPAVITTTLDAGLVERLDARAARQGLMGNDLLMGALMTAIGAHVSRATGAGGWIRLATPLSLRTKSDYSLPAVNRVSVVFLDRRPADRLDEARLLRGFRDEMNLIRSHRLGHILPLSLEVARWCPGGLAGMTRRPEPQSTAVLSNLGRCFHRSALADGDGAVWLGQSRLTDWWMVPPVRPGTALAAATHETCGRRTIAFHVDTSRVGLDDARRWLDGMRAALDGLAAGTSAAPRARAVAS